MSRGATKGAKIIEMVLMFLRHQFTIFSEFQKRVGSGLLLFRSAPLALSRAGVVVLLLGLQRTMGVRFGRIRFWVRFVSRRSGVASFMGDLGLVFPIMGVNGMCKTSKAYKGVGFALVNHIVLDMFCKTVIAC